MIIVLMGVSGSGKTTIGTLLAQRIGSTFADADSFHPAANVVKMAAGNALDDQDRQPWLERLNELMRGWYASGTGGILACSALKEKYRETLRAGMPEDAVHFVLLAGSKEMIAERIAERKGHFMKAGLLDSQFATLEMPKDALCIENDRTPEVVVEEILQRLNS